MSIKPTKELSRFFLAIHVLRKQKKIILNSPRDVNWNQTLAGDQTRFDTPAQSSSLPDGRVFIFTPAAWTGTGDQNPQAAGLTERPTGTCVTIRILKTDLNSSLILLQIDFPHFESWILATFLIFNLFD